MCKINVFLSPGGSVVERVKLKGFHGTAPPRVEFLFNLIRPREISPCPDTGKGCQIDRPFLISRVVVRGFCSLVQRFCLINSVNERDFDSFYCATELCASNPQSLSHGGGERGAMLNIFYGSVEVCEQAACA